MAISAVLGRTLVTKSITISSIISRSLISTSPLFPYLAGSYLPGLETLASLENFSCAGFKCFTTCLPNVDGKTENASTGVDFSERATTSDVGWWKKSKMNGMVAKTMVRRRLERLKDVKETEYQRVNKELAMFDGMDYKHWVVCMKPQGNPTSDEIIDIYINSLAKVLGSEEEAKKHIYSFAASPHFCFGCTVSVDKLEDIERLPGVQLVYPDSYRDRKKKQYGGIPFINGQPLPYHPKYFKFKHYKDTERGFK